MRRFLFPTMAAAALSTIVALTSSKVVSAQEAPHPADEPVPAVVAPVAAAPATDSAASPSGEKWRFVQKNGHWWYWQPSGHWVIWDGSTWIKYDPQTYQAFQQRTYSYRPSGGSSGYRYQTPSGYQPYYPFGGRAIYDQHGTIQYPYSRRSSGLQQLGAVPAMGGVRSLPGWGGER